MLVTGGAGFVGSHLVEELVARGHEVTVVDNLSRGSLRNLHKVMSEVEFVKGDLRRETMRLTKRFVGMDLVLNLAALNTGVDYDEGRTQVMFEENMLLQMMPLRMAVRAGVKRFVQMSSASVYSRKAMDKQVPTPESADVSDPEPSKAGYAWAKRMGEELAGWYAHNSKMETVVIRMINVYGERDHVDDLGHFIPVIMRKCLEARKKVRVFGSGRQKRSFLYVKDAVKGILKITAKGRSGVVYNLDSQDEHSVAEVVGYISNQLLSDKLEIVYDTTKPEGSMRRMLDTSKVKALGWRPQTGFDEGLRMTFEDVRKRVGRL